MKTLFLVAFMPDAPAFNLGYRTQKAPLQMNGEPLQALQCTQVEPVLDGAFLAVTPAESGREHQQAGSVERLWVQRSHVAAVVELLEEEPPRASAGFLPSA